MSSVDPPSLIASREIRTILRSKNTKKMGDVPELVRRIGCDRWMTRRENTLVHEAARYDNPELIQALKASDFPIDTPNNKHLYPLHWAVFYGSERALKALLACGHSVECADGRGMTPLHVAIKRRFITGVRVLLEHGANPMACMNGATTCRDILERMDIQQEFDYLEIKELLDEYQNNSFFSQVLILA